MGSLLFISMAIGMSEGAITLQAISGLKEGLSGRRPSCLRPAGSLGQGCLQVMACPVRGVFRREGWIPAPTSQLLLVGHIALDEQRLLRVKLLVQSSFTLQPCFKIAVHQRDLRRQEREEAGPAPLLKLTPGRTYTVNTRQDAPLWT